jgi:hypothetical protein
MTVLDAAVRPTIVEIAADSNALRARRPGAELVPVADVIVAQAADDPDLDAVTVKANVAVAETVAGVEIVGAVADPCTRALISAPILRRRSILRM